MSMSTYIKGFRLPDEKWRSYKKIYDACMTAGINPPKEVIDFFNDKEPDDSGVEINLSDIAEAWSDESSEGFQIEIAKLPKDIKIIRFYNNW